jgi:hypothetical protein
MHCGAKNCKKFSGQDLLGPSIPESGAVLAACFLLTVDEQTFHVPRIAFSANARARFRVLSGCAFAVLEQSHTGVRPALLLSVVHVLPWLSSISYCAPPIPKAGWRRLRVPRSACACRRLRADSALSAWPLLNRQARADAAVYLTVCILRTLPQRAGTITGGVIRRQRTCSAVRWSQQVPTAASTVTGTASLALTTAACTLCALR